jgi:hypothetical protein
MDISQLEWRKSSHSNPDVCVEVADTPDGGKAVRDSKQNGQEGQTILVFDKAEWDAFTLGVRDGEFS